MASPKIQQLQLLQQNLQHILSQKQQLESQLVELDSALSELRLSEKAYKVVGKIMISMPPKELQEDLQQKKESLHIRLNNFSKQEEKLNENIEKTQQEVLQELKPGKK